MLKIAEKAEELGNEVNYKMKRPNLFSQNVENAIDIVEQSTMAYSHFITKWEVTSNARAFYIPPYAWEMFFDAKGGNEKKCIERNICWQKDKKYNNKIYYYSSKKEYRIANFGGKSFEFLQDKYIGSLLIVAKGEDNLYNAYVLEAQKDIDDFLDFYRLDNTNPTQCVKGLFSSNISKEKLNRIQSIVEQYTEFPTTSEICTTAQDLIINLGRLQDNDIIKKCDSLVKEWYDVDFLIFEGIEEKLYRPYIIEPIGELNRLLRLSKVITNRRKSRAGLSLENHLSRIFDASGFIYEKHAETELHKKPDFLFPNSNSYHDINFDQDKLLMLAAKTTCKDRWRQVLNEADKIRNKYLFTLQPGVSNNQLKEMKSCDLTLVVPHKNLKMFDYSETQNVIDLTTFVSYIREKQQ